MARVIDVNNYVLVRDFDNYIRLFLFFEEGILSKKLLKIVKHPGKIYLQCEKEETYVGNDHKGFYSVPNYCREDFNNILVRNNYQVIPWEVI